MSTPPGGAAVRNTERIAANSFWYGLELFFTIAGALVTSVVVAVRIGPQRLGYFSFIFLLTNFTAEIGSFGLPMTTRKYMAEYLNRGAADVARAVYHLALKIQVLTSAGLTIVALILFVIWGDPAYRAPSVILILTMAPRMIAFIPSQANNAAEMMKRNTQPSMLGATLNISGTLFAVWMGWGLPGIAAAFMAGALLDTVLKLWIVHSTLSRTPLGSISPELRKRMLTFSGQGLVLMILNLLVWDRSDVFVLKLMNQDIRQVTFFALAFNITERILMVPNALTTSVGATMMAQYGRGAERLPRLAVEGAKYGFLLVLPLLMGIATISKPLVQLVYRQPYQPMIPVLAIAALFAIPKVLIAPPTALLQAVENQAYLIWVGCVCGIIDISLDFILTPHHGAIGAAVANGVAQAAASAAIWWRAYHFFNVDLKLRQFGKIALCGSVMAISVMAVSYMIPARVGLAASIAASIIAGVITWAGMLRITGSINSEDKGRLSSAGRMLPGQIRPAYCRLVDFVAGI